MNISPTEAADALRDIADSADRSREFKGYRIAAPYFFLWGAIWILGYGATGVSLRAAILWLPLTVIGIGVSAYLGWRNSRRFATGKAWGKRMFGMFVVIALFITATYAILPPHNQLQTGAFSALISALMYSIVGLWTYRRYLWLGIFLGAATMFGFFFLTAWFSFWMAVIGGGALILTGFWMRKA